MNKKFYGQIIVCEDINYDDNVLSTSLHNILNESSVNVLPSMIKLKVFMKFLFKEVDFSDHLNICVINEENDIFYEDSFEIRNFRKMGMNPGMDIGLNIMFPVVKQGNHRIVLTNGKNEVVAEYPLFISVKESLESV
ncbi:hypothetical protein ACMGD3_24965 [Lysinibacillus sphaericus]|uniref:hypothetical protein n=1 Tax=Lysinibacillus sphaericus TaxID=1421 RepID=UPI003F7B1A8B